MIEYNAYAKINIGLNVNFKREDDYHDLDSVMVPISMHDTISIEVIDDDIINFTCSFEYIKTNHNLAYKVANYLKKQFRVKKGVNIHIEKNIPVSGGMGGGSSDCAVVLKALNKLWGLNITLEKQLEIGKMFGADIPFSIVNKPAFITGIGEIIEPFDFNMNFYVIVVKMPFGVSTKSVFNGIDFLDIDMYNIRKVRDAIINNNLDEFNKFIGNNMESVTAKLHPEINQVKEILIEMGCFNSIMSGSGPTVIGFVLNKDDGQIITDKLINLGYNAYLCDILK